MAGKKAKAEARKLSTAPGSTLSDGHTVPTEAANKYLERKPSPGKGQGMFAATFIKAGTIVLAERPLFVINKPADLITERDIVSADTKLPASGKAVFDSVRHEGDEPARLGCSNLDQFHGSKFTTAHSDGYATGWGFFDLSSRFNNACLANTSCSAGEELTFVYSDNLQYMTTEERVAHFRFTGNTNDVDEAMNYFCLGVALDSAAKSNILPAANKITALKRDDADSGSMVCKCGLCTSPPVVRLVSDMRRGLMRHIICMIDGRDLIGEVATVKGVEPDFDIDDMYLHMHLFTLLAEAEGLLASEAMVRYWMCMCRLPIIQAVDLGLSRLSQVLSANIRTWMAKAARMTEVAFGDEDLERIKTGHIYKMVAALGPNGEITQEVESIASDLTRDEAIRRRREQMIDTLSGGECWR